VHVLVFYPLLRNGSLFNNTAFRKDQVSYYCQSSNAVMHTLRNQLSLVLIFWLIMSSARIFKIRYMKVSDQVLHRNSVMLSVSSVFALQ